MQKIAIRLSKKSDDFIVHIGESILVKLDIYELIDLANNSMNALIEAKNIMQEQENRTIKDAEKFIEDINIEHKDKLSNRGWIYETGIEIDVKE